VYDLQKSQNFLHYLPLLNTNSIYSIIVVGNKYDLLDSSNYQKFDLEKEKAELEKYDITTTVIIYNNIFT